MQGEHQIIQADLTYRAGAFHPKVRVAIAEHGRIERVGALPDPPTVTLPRQALLPGMVSAHSHAFQRALRGRGERFGQGQGDFWSWREAMYALVEQMNADEVYAWSLQTFREMLRVGITAVGEFHYLRHAPQRRFGLDDAVLGAARDAGIRIALLAAYYQTGGIGRPVAGAQERFATPSLQDFWGQFDRLSGLLDGRTQTLGIAPHSIRAVPLDDLAELVADAHRRKLVVHMHLEEQPQEIEECRTAYGRTPLELCLERLPIDERFTAVHCTHSRPAELDRLAEADANICLCPLTEANLGDGVPDAAAMARAGASLCLGTDSNARISLLEEMRWLDYAQRLIRQQRGCLRDAQGRVGDYLFRCATANGARALGLHAGAIEPGAAADFFTVDLDHPSLHGWTEDTLLDTLILGGDCEAIRRVCVAGRWIQ